MKLDGGGLNAEELAKAALVRSTATAGIEIAQRLRGAVETSIETLEREQSNPEASPKDRIAAASKLLDAGLALEMAARKNKDDPRVLIQVANGGNELTRQLAKDPRGIDRLMAETQGEA